MSEPVCIFRGATVRFATTFFDVDGNVTQPNGAAINVAYIENGQAASVQIEMTPPGGSVDKWTAQWDSRLVSPGRVTWSIHTEGPSIPYAVEDGAFELIANNANLPTF